MRNELGFKERLKRLVIIGMVSDDELLDRLVLKGGNLLDIAYGISTRASVDIDFSVDGDLESVLDLQSRIEHSLSKAFEMEGLVAFDLRLNSVPPKLSDDMKSFWGGYRIEFKVIESDRFVEFKDDQEHLRRNALRVGKRDSTKFKIDISNHEFCNAKEAKTIDGYTVFGYTPSMFVAEKLRALCQQMPSYVKTVKSHPSARARDFVDIHVVAEEFSLSFLDPDFHDIIRQTFLAKKVPLRLLNDIVQYREYHCGDFTAVEDTVKAGVTLESFDVYFDYVVEKCRYLEALWNE